MPKKAKGGGKMGRDESQTEEEMAKKREESVAQCLRDDLEKDEKSKTANLLRLNEGWRAVLRQTRDPELREDIMASRQMFEGQMDGLDSVIQNLLLGLQEKTRQSNWVHRMHLQRLESLWDLHETQMMTVQQHWENSMQQLNSEFCTKEKRLIALSQKEPVHLVNAISTVEQDYKKVMTSISKLFKESIKMYQQAAEAQAVSPRRRRIVRGAVQFCCKKEERLNKFIQRGLMDTEIKAEEMKKIQALKRLLAQTRRGLNNNKTRNQAEEQDLTVIRAEVNKKTEKLCQQLNESRSTARKQLINLSVQSDNTTKRLQAVIAKGEKVLRVGDMCQKLESKHKEVLSSLSSAADSETSVTKREEPGQISDFQHFHKLMVCMENALLVRDTLKKQKQALMQENQQLRLQVHQQMEDMTISDDTLDRPHAVLTVSRAASITARPSPIHKQLVQKNPEAPVM